MTVSADVDVAIVGAGAAGVGAARRLCMSGRSILIVEASDRVGGRARTVGVDNLPLDLGCGWLHSAERNPWVAIAEGGGLAVDRRPSAWGQQYRNLGFSPDEQSEARGAFDDFDTRLRTTPPPNDRAADALVPGARWNAYLDALSGYINGTSLETLSVSDYLAYDDAASDTNWRVPAGYGTLVSGAVPRVPLALSTPVRRINHHRSTLALETLHGTITARAAIVTVATNVLANGGITFDRGADDHLHAAANLPLGLADKLFLALDGCPDIATDRHVIGNPHSAATGSYYLRPFGRDVIECFYGGASAAALEGSGLDGAAAFAIDELSHLFGSGIRSRLRLLAGSAWGRWDGFGGSYSHALPGHAGARAVLARPIDNRVFFAGEACSANDFSTAHGALATGIAAAEAALAALD